MRYNNHYGDNSKKLFRPGRRKFLSLGASLVGISEFDSIWPVRRSIPTRSVVTIKNHSEPVEEEEVPEEWYNRLQRTRAVKKELIEDLLSLSPVQSIGIQYTNESIKGMNLSQQVVTYRHGEKSKVHDIVPEQIDRLEIATKERGELQYQNCETHSCMEGDTNLPTNNYHGGRYICSKNTGTWGTSGYPVEVNGEMMILSAAHVFIDEDSWACGGGDSPTAYTTDGDSVGSFCSSHSNGDYVLCRNKDIHDINKITNQVRVDGQYREVEGYFTKDGMAARASMNSDFTKEGITTGTEKGPLEETEITHEANSSHPCGESNDAFRVGNESPLGEDARNASGESGAPWLRYRANDKVAIAGHHFAGNVVEGHDCDDYFSERIREGNESYGHAAYEVAARSNFNIGTGGVDCL